jgi:glutathione synthase/RimK-type ligase-like ATP-grasp enzyme
MAATPAMDVAFVVDPLDELKAYKDSSIAMMRALARRGHRVHAVMQADLAWSGGRHRRAAARARPSRRRPRLVPRARAAAPPARRMSTR